RKNDPSPTARRFEAGTPAVVNCYAAEAGLKMILDIGLPAISARVRQLTRRCMERLDEEGFVIDNPRACEKRGPTWMSRAYENAYLVQRLAARDFMSSNRDSNRRASFHFYTTEKAFEALIGGLKANRELLA